MAYQVRSGFGRPPISDDHHNRCVELAEAGVSPKEAAKQVPISLAKIYEIYRNPVRKPAARGTE